MDVEITLFTSVAPSKPSTMIMAEATDAKAASGATAAPTLAHPKAIS